MSHQSKLYQIQIIIAVLATSCTISTGMTTSAVRSHVSTASREDCPGAYCVGEDWEGCCIEPTFVCCPGTEDYCSAELRYCPPSFLTGNPDFSRRWSW